MPRPPNRKNPVAKVRAALGLSVAQFAALIGHGAAMIAKVESGSKKLPAQMAEDIARTTGIPLGWLQSNKRMRFTAEQMLVNRPASAGLDDYEPSRVLDSFAVLLAAYSQGTAAGVNGDLLLHSVKSAAERFIRQWGLDEIKLARDFFAIVAVLDPDNTGRNGPGADLLKALADVPVVQEARRANELRTHELTMREATGQKKGIPPEKVMRLFTKDLDHNVMKRIPTEPAKRHRSKP